MSRSSTVANSRVLISNRGLVIKCSSSIGKVTTTTAKKPGKKPGVGHGLGHGVGHGIGHGVGHGLQVVNFPKNQKN